MLVSFFLALLTRSNLDEAFHLSQMDNGIVFAEENSYFFLDIGMKHQCTFKSRFPNISIIKFDPRAEIDIAISASYQYSKLLLNHFFITNVSSVISDKIPAKYRIVEGTDRYNTPYDYIYNDEVVFNVFSNNKNRIKFCTKEPDGVNYQIIVIPIIAILILILFLFYAFTTTKYSFNAQSSTFWLVNDKEQELNTGGTLSPVQHNYIFRTLAYSRIGKKVFNGVTVIKRHAKSITFERVAAIPFSNDFSFVFIFQENPGEPSKMGIKGVFQAEKIRVMQDPYVQITSYRNAYPIKIDFQLTHNVDGQIKCPLSLITPFQPFGQFASKTLVLLIEISKMIGVQPFLRGNFHKAMMMLCSQTGAKRALCYSMNNKNVFSYNDPILEPLSAKEILELPQKLPKDCSEFYTNDLLSDGLLCFVIKLKMQDFYLTLILGFDTKPKNEMMISLGSSLMSGTALFVYQLSSFKEESVRFNQFMRLISFSKNFAFFEIPTDLTQVFFFQSSIECLDIKQLRNVLDRSREHMQHEEQLYNILSEAAISKNPIRQRIIEMRCEKIHWISFSSSLTKTKDNEILTVIIEEISDMKEQEEQLDIFVKEMSRAFKTIGLHKFFIEDLSLETNEVCELIHRDSEEKRLRVLVDPQDSFILDEIKCHPMKCKLRLLDDQQQPVWFSMTCNQNVGYLFYINDLVEVNTSLAHAKPDNEKMWIWSVDLSDESVHSLYSFPTIWDYLSIDRNCEFSRFINFIHQDQKDLFITPYSHLLKGTLQSWSEIVQILMIGGKYEWHRLAIARSSNNYLYCVALNVNEEKVQSDKFFEKFNAKNELSHDARTMIWTFEDTNKPLKKDPVFFESGFEKILKMNWDYINKFVISSDQKEFQDRMKISSKHNTTFEMVVTFDFKGPQHTHLFMQGKYSMSLSKIIGYCIEVNDIYENEEHETNELHKLVQKRNYKLQNSKSLGHQYLCLFNDIYGLIDILLADAKTKQQITILRSIDACTLLVMHYFTHPLDDLPMKGQTKIFDIFTNLEVGLQTFHSYAKRNGVEFQVDFEGQLPEQVNGDPNVMNFIICVLCSYFVGTSMNQVKFNISMNKSFTIAIDIKDPADEAFVKMVKMFEQNAKTAHMPVLKEETQVLNRYAFHFKDNENQLIFDFNMTPSSSIEPLSAKPALLCVKDKFIAKQIKYVVHDELGIEIQEFTNFSEIKSENYSFIFVEITNHELPIIQKVADGFYNDKPLVCVIADFGMITSYQVTLYKPLVISQLRSIIRQYIGNQTISHSLFKSIVHADTIRRHVLIVEDNKTNQFVMTKLLETLGCTYDLAENGEVALMKLEEQKFDIVFMDYWLPILDGTATTKIIRKSPKHYSSIPIVGISAVPESQEECMKAGMDAFYFKPIRIHHIKDALTRFYQSS